MNNPFSPPKAPVEMPFTMAPRPAKVTLAVNILWVALAIDIASQIPGVREGVWDYENMQIILVMVLVMAIFYAFAGFVIYLIGKGQNWARWFLAALFSVGAIFIFSSPEEFIAQGALAVVIDLLITTLDIYAIALLFRKDSSRWFKGEFETETA